VVNPGGIVAILIYSSQMLLPGYPLLEAKLNTTSSGIALFTSGMRPELHAFRALSWFREVDLKDARAQTFVSTVQAPLSDDIHNAMTALIKMRTANLIVGITANVSMLLVVAIVYSTHVPLY